jgi:hypothetical protein
MEVLYRIRRLAEEASLVVTVTLATQFDGRVDFTGGVPVDGLINARRYPYGAAMAMRFVSAAGAEGPWLTLGPAARVAQTAPYSTQPHKCDCFGGFCRREFCPTKPRREKAAPPREPRERQSRVSVWRAPDPAE